MSQVARASTATRHQPGENDRDGRTPLWRVVRNASTTLLALTLALGVLAPISAKASNVQFVGNVAYSYVGNTAVLTANEVANFDPAGFFSGTLRLELWALPAPYSGSFTPGYKLAEYTLGQLNGGFHFSSINSGSIPFLDPPNGTWYFVMVLTEFTSAPIDDGYTTRDYVNFASTVVFGPPPPPPPALTPQIGLWWNPNESGSGYALDYKHGVLVVTIYSYAPNGAPQWYLASGPLSGFTFTSTLDKYVAGQCISCAYGGRPSLVGNDGTITITFSSPTTATAYLPGGRVTQIQPQAF